MSTRASVPGSAPAARGALAPLGDLAAREQHGDVDVAVHVRGRERLVLGAAKERVLPRGGAKRWASRAMVTLAAACFAALVLWFVLPGRPLTFVVEGATAGGPTEVIDAASAPTALRFSDGSRVVFDSASRGRMGGVTERGASVVLEQGVLHLEIVHREVTSWTVEAGPYRVRVTGTAFDVTWQPGAASVFEVRMREGTVVVEGPAVPQGMPLSAGQVLRVDGSGLRVAAVDDLPPLGPPVVEPTSVAAVPAQPPPVLPSAPAPSARSSASAAKVESWTERVARGDYAGVVADAEARGLDAVAESAPLSDLTALADAARYEKKPEIARRALEALRARFASTQAGKTATFLLARLADDGDGDLGRAITLYDAYLAHGGPFAAEALGRKMLAVDRSKGRAAAKPIAQVYLERYPEGSHARVAREIAGE